eukprot:SAG31_NODE_17485_length_669_cov_0.638596_1_plen_165_part_10
MISIEGIELNSMPTITKASIMLKVRRRVECKFRHEIQDTLNAAKSVSTPPQISKGAPPAAFALPRVSLVVTAGSQPAQQSRNESNTVAFANTEESLNANQVSDYVPAAVDVLRNQEQEVASVPASVPAPVPTSEATNTNTDDLRNHLQPQARQEHTVLPHSSLHR